MAVLWDRLAKLPTTAIGGDDWAGLSRHLRDPAVTEAPRHHPWFNDPHAQPPSFELEFAWLWTPETTMAFSMLMVVLALFMCCWISNKIGEFVCTTMAGIMALTLLGGRGKNDNRALIYEGTDPAITSNRWVMDEEEDDDVLLMEDHHRTQNWSPLTASLAKYLNRTVPDAEKTGRAAKHYGPYTSVPLMGGAKMIGAQCGCMIFVPLLTMIVFVGDVALAIIAGLDMLDRGSQTPYVQFSLAIGISVMYTALCVMALTQYFWERVLDYKYHNVWALAVVSVLAWSNFGIWASWISHFHGSADGVDSANTVPFVAWAAANAVGVSGFLARFTVLAVAVALRYTYDRVIEMQALVTSNVNGGSSIRDVLSGRRFPHRRGGLQPAAIGAGGGDLRQPFAHPMLNGTTFGAQQQQHRYYHHGGEGMAGRQRQRAPSAFRAN